MTGAFRIALPVLSRGTADRSELLRDPDRIRRGWSRARILEVDPAGLVATVDGPNGPRLVWTDSTADGPPAVAVLLGTVADVDHWALPAAVAGGAGLRQLGSVLDDTEAGLLTTAVAALGWHANGAFCPRCGRPSTPTPSGWSRTCPEGHQEWPRTDPAVIVLVHDGADRMVLAHQPIWPVGRYSVLAGFTEAGESMEGTVRREIFEEVGLRVDHISYLGSQPWPFPRSLMVGFAARADPDAPLVPQDGEIESAYWFHRSDIRLLLDAGGQARGLAVSDRARFPDGMALPDQVSIARRMVQGWADADRTR